MGLGHWLFSLTIALAATVYVDRVASREMSAASNDTLHHLSRAVVRALVE